ncbi:hypothetical protein Kpho02_20030 [Kitasatospora phosalacinea]|uniref:Uncharacterized protein n=1 Tax=Kitasatospora phosalacinea TaxID=2065 RepID=A0A9W6Q4G7_9ACTN|nr:hypothetical protein Kpho02_20030 [Kitasatospora phosalacinea]
MDAVPGAEGHRPGEAPGPLGRLRPRGPRSCGRRTASAHPGTWRHAFLRNGGHHFLTGRTEESRAAGRAALGGTDSEDEQHPEPADVLLGGRGAVPPVRQAPQRATTASATSKGVLHSAHRAVPKT